jgi:putative cardiolipin synthase
MNSALQRAVQPLVAAHAHESGFIALNEGGDAFAARILLADAAEHSIDAQYYIWRHDNAGSMLLQALLRAAERGVNVRLLLDDVNTAGLDAALAALDAHPRIEVRVFNPFRWRRFRLIGLLADFARLNRRMHNKSYTVDGTVTVVGGRNIGDEYFGTGDGLQFTDLDVLAIGPVVADVARDFERYWTSTPAQPLARVLAGHTALSHAQQDSARVVAAGENYAGALGRERCVRELLDGLLAFDWARAHLVSDAPAKVLGHARRRTMLLSKLREIVGTPQRELHLVSPYFVPTRAGVAFLVALARQGIHISVLTNSLEATDVAAVHAGYARWRRPLLRAGIALFESRRLLPTARRHRRRRGGSSSTSLHAKTFAIDGERVFVGSFNFDPRSAQLNTEMGLLIESPALARACADLFTNAANRHAYSVQLDARGALQWQQHDDAGISLHHREPGASIWRRAWVRILSWFPIEWML